MFIDMMLSGFLFQVMDNFFQIALNQLRPAAKNLQITVRKNPGYSKKKLN